MRYIVKLGTLPIYAGDVTDVKGALLRYADWEFSIEGNGDHGVQLDCEAVLDIGIGDNDINNMLDENGAYDLCRQMYRSVRRSTSLPPCAVISVASVTDAGNGWLHVFTPI